MGAGAVARSAAGLLFMASRPSLSAASWSTGRTRAAQCLRAISTRELPTDFKVRKESQLVRVVSFTNHLIKEGRTHLPGRHLVRAVDVDEAAHHGTDAAPAIGHPTSHEGRLDAS